MSCNSKITVKQWFSEDIVATVTDSDWVPVSLSIYDAVYFIMVSMDNTVVVNTLATFVDKPNGKIKYTLSVWNTSTVGIFKGYFKLMIAWVPKKSAPKEYFQIEIIDDLL